MGAGADNLKITVNIKELLDVLRANRQNHASEYEIARQGYQVECVKQLRKRATKIKAGKIQDMNKFVGFNIPVPQDYTHVYDQLIGMLEMAQETEIELTGHNYKAWVMDQWDWTSLADINKSYSVSGLCL